MQGLARPLPKRFKLTSLPTPIEELDRLGERIGVRLYVKRDDLLSLGLGGNKVRKLEYLVGDAIEKGCKMLATSGAVHSNHARLTAAAAAKAGMKAFLALWGSGEEGEQGNLLLDDILGADIKIVEDREEAERLVEEVEGDCVYRIPPGGASVIGALGYLQAAVEIASQEDESGISFDYMVIPTGTGATLAGLLAGSVLMGGRWKLIGFDVGFEGGKVVEDVEGLARGVLDELGVCADIHGYRVLDASYGGYGVISRRVIDAILSAARTEGLILDPVYTGKALAGFEDAVASGDIEGGSSVLFVHTGGIPILFQYSKRVVKLK